VKAPSAKFAIVGVALLAGCGTSPTPSPTPVETATAAVVTATAVPTAPVAPTPTPTPSATAGSLMALARLTFPPCPNPVCVGHGAKFTTCDSGLTVPPPSTTDRFSLCPFTARLSRQLTIDAQGGDAVGGGGDPVGGGQDPEWPTEAISTSSTPTGGTAEITFVEGANVFKTDLVIISTGGRLLVDDIYCAGADPRTSDAYASGWDSRATCSL
jgi:hypothetical protein